MNDPYARSRGQVLPIFAVFLLTLVLMLSVLFDASWGLLNKRQYQDTADAAALAAANTLQLQGISGKTYKGCSATASPPGAPQAAVIQAAKDSVAINMPGYDLTKVVVACGNQNYTVRVSLTAHSPGFFSSVAGYNGFDIGVTGEAVNGREPKTAWSIVVLNPTMSGSFDANGSITLDFYGSIHVNSSSGTAGSLEGGSWTVNVHGPQGLYAVGDAPAWRTTALSVYSGQSYLPNPLGYLASPNSYVTTWTSQTYPASGDTVIYPGEYANAVNIHDTVLMAPGIYKFKHGFQLQAGAQVFSVTKAWADWFSTHTSQISTTIGNAAWGPHDWNSNSYPSHPPTGGGQPTTAYCPVRTYNLCGLLLYAEPQGSNTSQYGVTLGGQGWFMLRAYNPNLPAGSMPSNMVVPDYENLLLWQASGPRQPDVKVAGGANINITGTLYTPQASVSAQGNGCSVGGDTQVTVQFIVDSFNLGGTGCMNFLYSNEDFTQPLSYGLSN